MNIPIPRRAALLLPLAAPAVAQGMWPERPINMIVPFAPGGTSEIVARTVAAELSKQLGQTVYVENKGGGAGIPAMQDVAKAAPDGHTLILGHVGSLAVNPYIFPNQPFDVNRDFMPVTMLAKVPNLFVIHPDVPAKNYKEFVAYTKANPGKLNYGTAGNASAGHLAMEYLKLVEGMFITHIPYRGAGPALNDTVSGQVPIIFDNVPSALPYIKDNRLVAIAVAAPQRLAVLPNVPTFKELGLEPVNRMAYYGILGPKGLPQEVVDKVNAATLKALQDPAVRKRIEDTGSIIIGNTPAQFARQMADELGVYKKVVEQQKLKLD